MVSDKVKYSAAGAVGAGIGAVIGNAIGSSAPKNIPVPKMYLLHEDEITGSGVLEWVLYQSAMICNNLVWPTQADLDIFIADQQAKGITGFQALKTAQSKWIVS